MFLQESATHQPARMMTPLYDSTRNQGKALDQSPYVVLRGEFSFPAGNWDLSYRRREQAQEIPEAHVEDNFFDAGTQGAT